MSRVARSLCRVRAERKPDRGQRAGGAIRADASADVPTRTSLPDATLIEITKSSAAMTCVPAGQEDVSNIATGAYDYAAFELYDHLNGDFRVIWRRGRDSNP